MFTINKIYKNYSCQCIPISVKPISSSFLIEVGHKKLSNIEPRDEPIEINQVGCNGYL